VNEPVANACRTCGRWPSLFDIEESKVEDVELQPDEEPPSVAVDVLEPEDAQPFEPEVFEAEKPTDAAPETPSARTRRIIGSVVVPLAVVIYLLVMLVTSR
jgi:hypothetical protein